MLADPVNGFELVKNVNGDPVTAEPFNLLCTVSLYNFTTDINWFWTSNGTTKLIDNSTILPGSILLVDHTYI